MNTLRALVAFSMLVGSVTTAHAVVLTFEDITGFTGRANFPALGIQNTYQGFQWPTNGSFQHWAVVNNSDSQFSTVGAFSGSQALWNWSDGDDRDIIFSAPQTVTGAYFNVFMAQQSWGADTVQFRAYDSGNNLIGTSAVLTLNDSVANPAWQWLAAGFTNVSRLNIHSTGGWWTMDDLTLGVSAVPAPAALLFVGLGVVASVVSVRRRRSRATGV
jgi:hypothetical protein